MNQKDIEAIFPLSHQQKGMFLETLLAPGSGMHVEQSVWAYQGELNTTYFKQAWQHVIGRHAMLRTAFVWKDRSEPLQVTLRSVAIPFEQQELYELPPSERQTHVEGFLRADRLKGFDLSRAPLMRLMLFQTDKNLYQIVWTSHHILMDGWCRPLVLHEVVNFYQELIQEKKVQSKPAHPYQEYIAWLKRQDIARAEKFWRETLQGFTKPTLPGKLCEDNQSAKLDEHYEVQKIRLSASDTQALAALTQKQRVTLNTLLQGMWALLLSRYSGDEDVVFGTTVSGRPSDLAGSETVVGLFISTLPFRASVPSNELLWPWLKDIQARHLNLRTYEYCSEGQVHQWSDMPGSRALFESILVFENYPGGPAASNELDAAPKVSLERHTGARTKYALTLLAIPGPELELQLIGDRRRFAGGQFPNILEHCVTLLKSFLITNDTPISTLANKIPTDQIPSFRPTKGSEQAENEAGFEAPRTQTEKTLANLFTKLFEVEQIGRDENFFGKGGHSLMALQLVSRVQEAFQVELPLQASFEAPTIAELARRIEEAQETARNAALPPIERVPRTGKLPLSVMQQALWEPLDPTQPDAAASPSSSGFLRGLFAGHKPKGAGTNPWQEIHPLVAVVHLDGALDEDAFTKSLELLSKRHETLRTHFIVDAGQVFQEVCKNGHSEPEDRPLVDFRVVHLPISSIDDEKMQNLLRQEKQHTFDLEKGNLWRVTLAKLVGQSYVLVLALHPLIADAPSARVLVRDLASLYQAISSGKPASLPELPIQYADYSAWQHGIVNKDTLKNQLDFWKQSLNGHKPLFSTNSSHNGNSRDTRHAYSETFMLTKTHVEGLKALSQQQAIPWTLTLAATFQTLLHCCTSEEDIALAISIPHRPRKALEDVVGPFANYLTLRTPFSNQPGFLDVLQHLRDTFTSSFGNQDIPFETIAKHIQPTQIQAMFTIDDKTDGQVQPSGITFSDLNILGNETNFQICMRLQNSDAGLCGQVAYNPDLFDAATIERFVKDYLGMIENILQAPESPISAFELGR